MPLSATIPQTSAALAEGRAAVIDVREPYEYASGHVPGAINMPMATIPVRLGDLPRDTDLYVICESGARSWQVVAFLERHGIAAHNVEGGTGTWRMMGLPLATPTPAR
jgi:rhodanese-related sulfurtransferase